MKRFFLLALLSASAAYGQDVYTGASTSGVATENGLNTGFQRSLLVYFYGNSGNLNNIAAPVFSGNDSEFGLRYSQNFQNAPWLTVFLQADLSVNMNWQYDLGNMPIPNTGSVSINSLTPILRLGVGMTPYFRMEMRTEGVMAFNGFYTARWGRHFLSVLGGIDLNFLNVGNSEYTVGLSYEYKIMQWVLGTAFGFRFGNEFLDSFHIRWDGIIAYNIDGCTLWGRLRYEPRRILTPGSSVQHNLMLMAGFNYNFDFIPANAKRF